MGLFVSIGFYFTLLYLTLPYFTLLAFVPVHKGLHKGENNQSFDQFK